MRTRPATPEEAQHKCGAKHKCGESTLDSPPHDADSWQSDIEDDFICSLTLIFLNIILGITNIMVYVYLPSQDPKKQAK